MIGFVLCAGCSLASISNFFLQKNQSCLQGEGLSLMFNLSLSIFRLPYFSLSLTKTNLTLIRFIKLYIYTTLTILLYKRHNLNATYVHRFLVCAKCELTTLLLHAGAVCVGLPEFFVDVHCLSIETFSLSSSHKKN